MFLELREMFKEGNNGDIVQVEVRYEMNDAGCYLIIFNRCYVTATSKRKHTKHRVDQKEK